MAASVKIYWSAGLSLLLAVIFVPPVAHLLSHRERKADTPGTGYVFIDILGDDTTKKVIALLTLAAPLLFPLLEKALALNPMFDPGLAPTVRAALDKLPKATP